MPSVHVVPHLRCRRSRSSFYWWPLLYQPGWETFFRQAGASSHLCALRIRSLVQTEREKKTTDVGFRTEWPYRVTCRTFPFWIIPHRLFAKTASGVCARRVSRKACPRYWHLVAYGCECESSKGTVWVFARVDLYSVFVKFCEWLRGYGKRTIKHAVPDSDARAAIICIKTSVLSVCEGVGRYIQCNCVHVCASTCACVSASVHNISHTILLQYFYTSGRTVSCIIVSLNLGKRNPNVYLIVLFFVAEKTVQKGVQQTLSSSHFLISLSSVFFKNGM